MKKLQSFGIFILVFVTAVSFLFLYIRRSKTEVCITQTNINTSYAVSNNYNFNNLINNDGIMEYIDNKYESVFGIDISSHQQEIDFEKVKNDGVNFVMIRVGYRGYSEGSIKDDPCFEDNIKSAIDAGLDVGVYFFSQAINKKEARVEANYVLDKIKNYDIKYPVVFDMELLSQEDRILDVNFDEKTDIALAFCEVIEKNGYKPMIYGSVSWLVNAVSIHKISKYDLWIANYNENPNFEYDFKMWQYSHEGAVDGIQGKVDMNIFMKEIE